MLPEYASTFTSIARISEKSIVLRSRLIVKYMYIQYHPFIKQAFPSVGVNIYQLFRACKYQECEFWVQWHVLFWTIKQGYDMFISQFGLVEMMIQRLTQVSKCMVTVSWTLKMNSFSFT